LPSFQGAADLFLFSKVEKRAFLSVVPAFYFPREVLELSELLLLNLKRNSLG
jgi:hypothetical protein